MRENKYREKLQDRRITPSSDSWEHLEKELNALENKDKKGLLEAPNFTKPIKYDDLSVPSEYLKGNHAKIHDLKNKLSVCKTKYFRP